MSERRPRILFLADLPPWPLHGGGQIKSYLTLHALSEIGEVTLVTFLRRPEDEAHLEALKPLCEAHGFPLTRARWRDAATGVWSLLTDSSFVMNRNASSALQQFVNRLLAFNSEEDVPEWHEARMDIIHVDHLQMMQFVPGEVPHCKVVLDCHNVEHDLVRQTGAAVGEWADFYLRPLYFREAARLREVEADACRRADLILAVTEADAAQFRALVPEKADAIEVVPIGMDTTYFLPVWQTPIYPPTLLFLGTLFWPPNVDALRWFCDDILPRIQNYIPDVKILVAGARPSRDVRDIALATPAVELIANPADVRPYAARASAFIAPIRFGGGMRVKTLCAMALGLPIIATPQGAAGIEMLSGEEGIIAAENADAFAAAVIRVLADPEFAEYLAEGGRALVEDEYSAAGIMTRLQAVYQERVL